MPLLAPLPALTVFAALAFPLAGCNSLKDAGDRAEAPPELTEEEQARLQRLNLESFDEIWTTVRDRHYDPELAGVDWEAARDELRPLVEEAATRAEARAVMQRLIDRLGDSHMAVVGGEAYTAITGGEDEGNGGERDGEVGIEVRLADIDAGTVLVTRVRAGSPAEDAGVQTGWELLQVEGRDVGRLVETLREALEERGRGKLAMAVSYGLQGRLAGEVGGSRTLHFLDGEGNEVELEIPLVRGEGEVTRLGALPPTRVRVETRRIEHEEIAIGHIGFSAFLDPPRVMGRIEEAMEEFIADPVEGVVLDLRGNMGGIVLMVPGIASFFIDDPDVKMGTLRSRATELNLVIFPRLQTYDGPVAVLIDATSVSAAELLAGGLQATGRARVFGQSSAGEALPSMITRLANGDGFLYVIADYVNADGQRLEGEGVQPDEPVEYERQALLEGRDPVLEAALEWVASQAAVTGGGRVAP